MQVAYGSDTYMHVEAGQVKGTRPTENPEVKRIGFPYSKTDDLQPF